MGRESTRNSAQVWRLAERQQGVVTRRQLLGAGFGSAEIDRRIGRGRLHRLWRGVYAVGRPRLTLPGWWRAAVLACGYDALLSHDSAAAPWGIRDVHASNEGEQPRPETIHVSVSATRSPRRSGIRVHRRTGLSGSERSVCRGIAVTTPARTLLDLSTLHCPEHIEAWVNQADKLGLIDPEALRSELEQRRGMDGVPLLRSVLDRRTFQLTDSELERRFLRVVRRARLPAPLTQQSVNGFRVDFYWPELRLIAETDGLRYHRTPSQQAKDRRRDQWLVAAGFTVLRFTHAQVAFELSAVVATLRAVADRVTSGFPPIEPKSARDPS
jgi:very-short-patch-repair endonuclease